MQFLEQFQLNVYAFLILIILTVVVMMRLRVSTFGKQLLLAVISVTALAIVLDTLAWVVEGQTFVGAYFLEYSANVLLLLLAPVIACFMIAYVNYRLRQKQDPLPDQILRFLPFWFTFIMLIINAFEPIYFDVLLGTNTFVGGSLIWIHYLMLVLTYFYMVGLLIKFGNSKETGAIVIFSIFFLLPLVGMLIQIMNAYVLYSWTFIVLSILMVFVFLESADGELDFLTKLYNRRSYEAYLTQLIERQESFSILYIDLDSFKAINDQHGHLMGDKVLVGFGRCLKQQFPNSKLIARLGGDEFMVVLEEDIDTEQTIHELRTLIQQCEFLPFKPQFSYGLQAYETEMSVDELYVSVDRMMYEYKRANRKLRRRRSDE